VVAWTVAEVESAEIAADLVSRACLKERYCRPRGFGSRQSHQQPLILHADNGNAMRAATLESRLEELGVLRSFSGRGSATTILNRNHCSAQPSIDRITTADRSPAMRRHASG
jgi:transposase InsO family protein